MEKPRDDELKEECSSTESGWTMYLTSPVRFQDVEEQIEYSFVDDDGIYSDDSMASDASSGPAHHEYTDHGGDDIFSRMAHTYIINKLGKEDDVSYDDEKHVEEDDDQGSSISPSTQGSSAMT